MWERKGDIVIPSTTMTLKNIYFTHVQYPYSDAKTFMRKRYSTCDLVRIRKRYQKWQGLNSKLA